LHENNAGESEAGKTVNRNGGGIQIEISTNPAKNSPKWGRRRPFIKYYKSKHL